MALIRRTNKRSAPDTSTTARTSISPEAKAAQVYQKDVHRKEVEKEAPEEVQNATTYSTSTVRQIKTVKELENTYVYSLDCGHTMYSVLNSAAFPDGMLCEECMNEQLKGNRKR